MTKSTPFANSFYVGINVEDILYGIELILYFKTIRVLLGSRGARKKSNMLYALFSTVMVFLVTVRIATQAIFGQKMWLLNPNYPGGADAYWKANIGVWYMDLATTAIIVLQLMTNAFMIYRCQIIWNSYRIVFVPVILWLATLALGVLVTWVTILPARNHYSGIAPQLSLAYWSVSVVLGTTLTWMICYRVLRHGRKIREYLGPEYASLCLTVAAIIVESLLPYTLSGIVSLVSSRVASPTSTTFTCVYFLMMCISPQMLILRVMTGNAWGGDMFHRPRSTPKFNTDGGDTLGSHGSGTGIHLQTLSNVYDPEAGCRKKTNPQV